MVGTWPITGSTAPSVYANNVFESIIGENLHSETATRDVIAAAPSTLGVDGSGSVLRDTESAASDPITRPRGNYDRASPGVQQEPEVDVDGLRGSSTQEVNPYANDPRCQGCGSRYGELKDWKKYVQSEAHHFEHKPACTKYCDACMQGMTRDIKHMKGKFNRPIDKFGDIIICDHTYMLHDEQMPGLGGFKETFNMLSLHRNFRWSEHVLFADKQDANMHCKSSEELM